MSTIDEKYLPIAEVDLDGELVGSVMYKTKLAPILCSIVAVALCLTLNWILILFAIFILGLAFFITKYVKDQKVADIYDTFIIVYLEDEGLARRIDYDNVVEWTCKHNDSGVDAIMLILEDGETIYKDTFAISKAYKMLNKLIPLKESRKVKEAKDRKFKLKFQNPFAKWKK